MRGDEDWQALIVHSDRWAGMCVRLPEWVLEDGRPPALLVVHTREIRVPRGGADPLHLEQRERVLRCRYVAALRPTVFYAPVPGQLSDDEPWPDAARSILAAAPDPAAASDFAAAP